MPIYTVITLDVLNNAESGYKVNKLRRNGKVEIPDLESNEEILAALVDAGYLPNADNVMIDDDHTWIHINSKKDGKPILQLMPELNYSLLAQFTPEQREEIFKTAAECPEASGDPEDFSDS